MRKWKLAILISIVVLVILFFAASRFAKPGTPETTAPFIAANPFDLTQINAISQFRSCEGQL